MDDDRAVEWLDRIDALGRRGAPASELLTELRGLMQEAERPPARGGDGEEVVERLRTAPHGT